MVHCTTMSNHPNVAHLNIEGGDVTINFYNGGHVDQRTFESYQPHPPSGGPPRSPSPAQLRPPNSSTAPPPPVGSAPGQLRPPTSSTAPPPPGGSAQRPGCSGASPSCPPNASGSTRRGHVSVPNRQFVRDETVDAVNNLMKRVRQDETDRADMELARVNVLAHREIDTVRAKIARVESGDSSSSD